MQKFFVYMFVDHNKGNPIYIGKGCKNRDAQHEALARCNHKKGYLYNWMRKYHSLNGVWPRPFRLAEGLTEKEAFEFEIGLIGFYGRIDLKTGCLFNRTDGGEGCYGKSPDVLERIAAKKRGVKLSPESIAKRTATILGRKWSAETKLKMSMAAQGRKMSPEAKAKISAAVRARPPQSAETLAKISAANKGKPSWNKGRTIPDDVKVKMSAAHKGKKYTAEQIVHYSVAATIREAKKRMQLKMAA
jgi:hypothetical protein